MILKIFSVIIITFFVGGNFIVFYHLFKYDEVTTFGKIVRYFIFFVIFLIYLGVCGRILGIE
jgi:hypothetical protein